MKKFYSFLILSCAALAASAATAPRHLQVKRGVRHNVVSTPEALPATDITSEGFTANWKAVPGTETYSVLVYQPSTAKTSGTYTILEESFDLVDKGTTIEPYFPDETFVELSDYDWTFTPDWQGFWPVFAQGKVSGIIYSPYIDLVNDGGKFTVTMEVEGTAGAQVVLTSNGDTQEKVTFDLTETGTNTFTHTFTNGCHDTYLTFVDNGILDDPEGNYTDKYDFLDHITVTQNLKAGDLALRLVATAETALTHKSFATLPYRNGALELAYDVQANVLIPGPDYPEDEYDYEVEHSLYSALQYVTLPDEGGQGSGDDDPENPEHPELNGNTYYVGNYENPTDADVEDGTWWYRAPYQWYTRYSGSQIIYTPEMLAGLKAGDVISEISFKYQDQGAFVFLTADLWMVAQNSEVLQFEPKPDTDKYPWIAYDSNEATHLEYSAELFYMGDEEIAFTLAEPLVYDGKSIVVTCWSENQGDEAQSVASIVKYCGTHNTMCYGNDAQTFDTVVETGYNYPYQTPLKFVPVAKFTVDRPTGIDSVIAGSDNTAEYFDLQGRHILNPSAGIYIRKTANGVEKVIIK